MGRHILSGNPPIEVVLRQSAQARRLSLRVSRLDGRVTLTMPRGVPAREGIAFVTEKEGWLRRHLANLGGPEPVRHDGVVPYRGQDHLVVPHDGRGVSVQGGQIHVSAARPVGGQLRAFMRHQARAALAEASDVHAARIGRRYTKLTLRDTRSRWGSCTADGGLMYSWRLIMAPPAVLNYVAAHEVAHLVEMNHSAAFWRVVEGLCPDYAAHRGWLREYGERLHRITFDD